MRTEPVGSVQVWYVRLPKQLTEFKLTHFMRRTSRVKLVCNTCTLFALKTFKKTIVFIVVSDLLHHTTTTLPTVQVYLGLDAF